MWEVGYLFDSLIRRGYIHLRLPSLNLTNRTWILIGWKDDPWDTLTSLSIEYPDHCSSLARCLVFLLCQILRVVAPPYIGCTPSSAWGVLLASTGHFWNWCYKHALQTESSSPGKIWRGKQTPPPEPAAPAAAPEGLANCFWVTRAESLKQHQISKTCRQNTSKHNSNEFGFLQWHICRSLIFRFAISPFLSWRVTPLSSFSAAI